MSYTITQSLVLYLTKQYPAILIAFAIATTFEEFHRNLRVLASQSGPVCIADQLWVLVSQTDAVPNEFFDPKQAGTV